jgi:hypothetical protein
MTGRGTNPDAQEATATDDPKPLGKPVHIKFFADASFASNAVTQKYTIGIIIFLNGAGVDWVSKRQATVETFSYGTEFTACWLAVEKVEELRLKLRQMGVLFDGPASGF